MTYKVAQGPYAKYDLWCHMIYELAQKHDL